jgi:hypothetical protein
VPPEYANVVAVEYSPGGEHAVVFIAYNEPPDIEPYVVLCEKTSTGWVESLDGSGGGLSWMSTATKRWVSWRGDVMGITNGPVGRSGLRRAPCTRSRRLVAGVWRYTPGLLSFDRTPGASMQSVLTEHGGEALGPGASSHGVFWGMSS